MTNKEIIKVGQVVFLYSKPPEKALIGRVDNIDYPFITIRVIPRSVGKNKFGTSQKIDISKNIPLSIFSEKRIKEYMTTKEQKVLKEYEKEDDMVDLFADQD